MNAVPRNAAEGPPGGKAPRLTNGVIAVILVVVTETMLLAGLISAHIQFISDQIGEIWPPLDQPRLPVSETVVGSMSLLLSGGALLWAQLAFRSGSRRAAAGLTTALLLGAFFVVFQGVHGVGLIRAGLDFSSAYGAFFYLIVGAHAVHAAAALAGLGWAWVRLRRSALVAGPFMAAQVFWYFAVLAWPVIYFQLYQ